MDKLQAEFTNRWVTFKDDEGAGMVEYALLVVFIALIAIIGIAIAGNSISDLFNRIGTTLDAA